MSSVLNALLLGEHVSLHIERHKAALSTLCQVPGFVKLVPESIKAQTVLQLVSDQL